MSSAVHFRGIDAILQAFQNKGIPYFAVSSGKQIIHKNATSEDMDEAAAELENFLRMLNQGSNAVYTLKIYEDIPKAGIKENTPADYSLNFRLNFDTMMPDASQIASYNNRNDQYQNIMAAIAALNARIDEVEEEDDDEEDEQPQTVAGFLNGMIQRPEVQQMIMSGVMNFFNKSTPTAMAGFDDDKLDQAILILKANDDKLGDDLMKLAQLAQNNPAQFNMLLGMLRQM